MMGATMRRLARPGFPLRSCQLPWRGIGIALAMVLLVTVMPAAARPMQFGERVQGEWLVVPSPITSEVFKQVRNDSERAIKRGARILVYHFQPGDISDLGPCSDLAQYFLAEINARVLLVGYADRPLNGPAVLPLLACNSVYLGAGQPGKPDASIGFDAAALARLGPLNPARLTSFVTVAEQRGRDVALIVKMADPQLVVYQLTGKRFRLDPDRAERLGLRREFMLAAEERHLQPLVYSEAGKPGIYSALEAERVGLATRTVKSPQQLVERLGLPPAVLRGNWLSLTDPRAAVIQVKGVIDGGTYDMVARKLTRAIENFKASCLIFELTNVTGSLRQATAAEKLARLIRDRAKAANVLTVAYIPDRVSGVANFLVFACDQIVLGPEGSFGDCTVLVLGEDRQAAPDPTEVEPVKKQFMQWGEEQFYPPILIRGMFEPDLEIVAAVERPDPNRPAADQGAGTVFLDKKELDPQVWVLREDAPLIKEKGSLLSFNTRNGPALGLVRAVLQNRDLAGVYALYGIKRESTEVMRADWLDHLVNLLRHEVTTVILSLLGFLCLAMELKSPGLALPGIVAAVCFVLVFWSHSAMAGDLFILSILLFILGIVLLLVELFILPGFGITGVSGIALMLLSLALLVLKQWPQSQAEWWDLAKYFGMFAVSLGAAFVVALMMARSLPHVPYLNKLILPAPLEETSAAAASLPPAMPPELLGAIGTAVTELRPAGKAVFGDQYIDVVSEGGYVEAGARVQVVEIDGLRVVVRTV